MASLSACAGPDSSSEESAELPPPDNAVAVVDQTVIYNAAVQREALAQGLVGDGERLSPDDPEYDRLVDELVDQRLLALEARRRGLQNSPEARRRIAAAEERILGNILLETEIAVQVTDEAAQRLYSEQTGLARPGEQIRARHILVDSLEAAEAIIALFNDGRDFAELAVQYSQDVATRIQGGDLGYFSRDGVLPEIASAAFAAREGELAGPIETEAGWHVLLIIDRRAPSGPSFEEIRPSIVRFLTFETISRLVDSLREDASIEIVSPESEIATESPAIALDAPEAEAGEGAEDNGN
ncbi:peptidylprolyl isomerase [Hyphobacterium sp. HN65]|uniref:Parvulin-like PPIase n=1 Tax=Hyphobacterium lacteum TaxID=3116575 RepID=A0ABU7LR07_9PROT|nr:peptidylprolyl isomerase [Hyphobacterium sp. HN65]MEE2526066.1 peptidylprolyl isomerase [Hyphobacterium sp. HN65]